MIFQELSLVQSMTVAENIFLGEESLTMVSVTSAV
jgi:ABC-type sugar transport system ATPase subunit